MNHAWKDALGYRDEEIPSLRFLDVVHPDSRSDAVEALALVMTGEPIREMQAEFITKDGRKLLAEGSTTPRIVDGLVVLTRSIFRDVTERRCQNSKWRSKMPCLPHSIKCRRMGFW